MTAVLGYVLKGDYVLLIRRGTEPFKGFWCLPGGLVETGESSEEACIREVTEKTGVEVTVLGEVARVSVNTPVFLCENKSGALRSCPPETLAVGWFPLGDNLPMNMPPFIIEFLKAQIKNGNEDKQAR